MLPTPLLCPEAECDSHAHRQPDNAKYWSCAILGCTGSVGQRFIDLLSRHPYFTIEGLGASSRSAGKPYREAVHWVQSSPISSSVADLVVQECRPENFKHCHIIFSGLDSSVAGDVETAFTLAKFPVFSNAKNHRQDANVPLVIPTLNPEHMALIPHQREALGCGKGFLVCNSNCAVVGVAVPIRAMEDMLKCKVATVSVVTMQAISGAGYPGVSCMDMLDNIVPFISGEEDKLEDEARKILGAVKEGSDGFNEHRIRISAACNRVQVLDGHMACVSLSFDRSPRVSPEEVKAALRGWKYHSSLNSCPSAPRNPIILFDEENRPQPRLDRYQEGGMAVCVGRVRKDETEHFDIKFVSLSHNTVLGAAGASILNAEVAISNGWIH
ncbi:MAG: hypothetical protein M1829_002558 [Trizodia sp. TS-e1964]|nr:MAG: hypothetical protein M1829_002558 [Trizodia sp. TS-e1964]